MKRHARVTSENLPQQFTLMVICNSLKKCLSLMGLRLWALFEDDFYYIM